MIRKWFNQVRYGKIEKSDSPEDICVICYENWTNAGPHGLASLPCGHLFGHSCITQWLRNGQTCPVCNHSTTAADIRLIRARNLTAIDNSNEVILRREVDELKVKNRALQTHCDRLTKINNFLYLTSTLQFLYILYKTDLKYSCFNFFAFSNMCLYRCNLWISVINFGQFWITKRYVESGHRGCCHKYQFVYFIYV